MSRLELAERVGVNSQTIGYLERGEYNPSLALAFRLSDVFSLPVEKIFVRKEYKRKTSR
jgi:DNA-binding XRE family transcriptional regulator